MAEVQYVQPTALSEYALWLGVPNVSHDMLRAFDPAYTGHVHIFVINQPVVMTRFYPDKAAALKAAIERMSTSFTGLPELTLNFQDQVHGFADRKVPHATSTMMEFDQATIRVLESKGTPVHSAMMEWIENIGDPISKLKNYKGRADFGDMQYLEYGIQNHSMSFIVCLSDPTLTRIQGRAHYITAAQPVSITNEHYNWNAGEIGIIEGYDLNFRGILRWGPYIDAKAFELLALRRAAYNYYAGSDAFTTGTKTITL